MELEALKNDLLTVINHYGKTIPIGTLYYVVKDVLRDVGDAYNQWLEQKSGAEQKPESAEEPAPAEVVEGEVEG